MINFIKSTSNNISFPSDTRKVMLLIDGEYYRLFINKWSHYRHLASGDVVFDNEMINYALCREKDDEVVGAVSLRLITNNHNTGEHEVAMADGQKEVPDDYFELRSINVSDEYKGVGTAFLSYVMNDIIKFNKLHGKTIKVLFKRTNTKITLPFYAKFGARVNNIDNLETLSPDFAKKFTFMIIDEPKATGEVPLELADNYDYGKAGEPNPFTEMAAVEKE